MKELNRNLLLDLARLLQRYSDDDFDELARCLSDDAFRLELVALIENMGRLSRDLGGARKPRNRRSDGKRAPSVDKALAELGATDPTLASRLRKFQLELLGRRTLQKSSQLRLFADHIGMAEMPRSIKRDQAISSLIRHMVGLSSEVVQAALSEVEQETSAVGAYDRWTGIILGPTSQRQTP